MNEKIVEYRRKIVEVRQRAYQWLLDSNDVVPPMNLANAEIALLEAQIDLEEAKQAD